MNLKINVPIKKRSIIKIPFFGKVHPLKRPRKGRAGNIYQPKDNQMELLEHLSLFSYLQIKEPCIIDLYVYFKGQINKYPASKNYGDVDNLTKAVLDALVSNGILKDDGLVVGCSAYKAFSTENFAVVEIWSIQNSSLGNIKKIV